MKTINISEEQLEVLLDFLKEEKEMSFEEFAKARLNGATKITNNAKEKGGSAMLTYHHFNVKLPHYKKASEGKFNLEKSKKEFSKLLKELCKLSDDVEMGQIKFQKLVGLIEVLGELIIKHKK
jgi:hypothetical protein